MKILVFVKDLFFRAKIEAELKRLGADFEFVNSPDGLVGEFDHLILDLEEEGSFDIAKRFPEKVLGFCSHKNAELIRKAKEVGCKVYPRSIFTEKLRNVFVS